MADPFDIVIFGACGDLALRKLVPALYRAYREAKLPAGSRVICTCRNPDDVADYSGKLRQALQKHLHEDEFCADAWDQFQEFLTPLELDISTIDERWQALGALMNSEPDKSRIFYLAIPPTIFGVCCQQLAQAGLVSSNSRVVVEKPLGYDAASADEINTEIAKVFDESCIYRIDHYLGKETGCRVCRRRDDSIPGS